MKGIGIRPLGDYLNSYVIPSTTLYSGTIKIGILRAILNDKSSLNIRSTSSSDNNSSSSAILSSTSPSTSP